MIQVAQDSQVPQVHVATLACKDLSDRKATLASKVFRVQPDHKV